MRPLFSTVTLPTDDLERAIAFCTTVLGFEVDARYGDLVYLATGPIRLALYPREELARYVEVDRLSPTSSTVLSLQFPSREDVDRTVEGAVAKQAVLTRAAAPFSWGGYGACLRDPDGHLWELVHAPDRDAPKV